MTDEFPKIGLRILKNVGSELARYRLVVTFWLVSATLEEVKKKIEALPAEEVFELKSWLVGKADFWDRQIIEDIEAGQLQPLLQRLDAEIAAGEVTEGFTRG